MSIDDDIDRDSPYNYRHILPYTFIIDGFLLTNLHILLCLFLCTPPGLMDNMTFANFSHSIWHEHSSVTEASTLRLIDWLAIVLYLVHLKCIFNCSLNYLFCNLAKLNILSNFIHINWHIANLVNTSEYIHRMDLVSYIGLAPGTKSSQSASFRGICSIYYKIWEGKLSQQ